MANRQQQLLAARRSATAIIGMGKTGQSVANYLLHRGISCEAFDEHAVELPASMQIQLHIGQLDADTLSQFERIIVSPGISWNHAALAAAREHGVPVHGDLELFEEHYQGDLIAITGTNGKTTTVSLIDTMLDTLAGGIEAGGNIGMPMLDLIADGDEPQRVVLELSSFQLERANPIHPRWAALLNVQPDHADMHENSDAYKAAKLRLFAGQGDGDKAMLPANGEWNALADDLRGRGVYVRRFGIGDSQELDAGVQQNDDGSWAVFWHHYEVAEFVTSSELPLQGQHQHLNLAVAAQAAADFGVSASVIRQSLTSFRGLPHRMQSLGLVAGREWFDDSKATNPDAARAALSAFHHVIWICGGLRKGLDVSVLKDAVTNHVEQMFIIGNDPKPYAELAYTAGVPASFVKTMDQAVKQAAHAQAGLPVLLSPAAASQDQFRDYVERGRVYAAEVKALEPKP
ncbi:UDP-N-acetylmuramoyl-L-alanine--D-glutamate ligase [Mariprofundus micogutta]|nr:UDP-N-acetylmuramoyl-L-alanine--D-glutamate ligase [Mariprofundus micogutta]